MDEKLTRKSLEALSEAVQMAAAAGNPNVDGLHLLAALIRQDGGTAAPLLRAVGAASGRQMVLNTSFNVKGQPIVNTPKEALETFLGTSIDYLFIENTLISRT